MMPEDERDFGIDPTEEYFWDPDNGAPGESEVADHIAPEDEEDDE